MPTTKKKSCPKGEIRRNSYTRKAYVTSKGKKVSAKKVKSTCVPNKGLPGKTPANKKVLPKLKEGMLTEYGYKLANNAEKRKTSLKKAIKNEGSLPVLRRVVVLRTYDKNDPKLFSKLDKDVKFIQTLREKEKNKLTKKTTTSKKKTVRFSL
jgi:hypothetical protein